MTGADGVPDGSVNGQDITELIAQFGADCSEENPCSADIAGANGFPDGSVDGQDITELIVQFGREDCAADDPSHGSSQAQYHVQVAFDSEFDVLIVDYFGEQTISAGSKGTSGVTLSHDPTSDIEDLTIGYYGDVPLYWITRLLLPSTSTVQLLVPPVRITSPATSTSAPAFKSLPASMSATA